jgi:hypothetical protein
MASSSLMMYHCFLHVDRISQCRLRGQVRALRGVATFSNGTSNGELRSPMEREGFGEVIGYSTAE